MGLKENLIEIVAYTMAMIAIVALMFGGLIAYEKYAYQWSFNSIQLSHGSYSVVAPKLVGINWKNGPLPIKIDGIDPLPLDFKGTRELVYYEYADGVFIQSNKTSATIFNFSIGEHNLQIGNDKVVVRVFASKSEMEAQKEPGFERLAAISAFAIIFAIRRNRAGG